MKSHHSLICNNRDSIGHFQQFIKVHKCPFFLLIVPTMFAKKALDLGLFLVFVFQW